MSVHDFEDDALTALQVSRDLLLAMALAASRDLDPTDNLILLGISQANVRQIVADPELQLRYAFAATMPPDDVRKPISAAALSRALGLPLETVRRRVARLAGLGLLVGTARGLIVPGVRLDTSHHKDAIVHLEIAFRRAFSVLAAAGFFLRGDLPEPRNGPSERPVRAIGRLIGDYYLRMLAPLRACCGDPMDAIIVLFLLRAAEGQGSDVQGRMPSPIRPSEVARAFAGSPETVRRRLRRLVDAGICQRSGPGYVVPPAVVEEVLLPRMAGPSQLNLRRLFRQIAAVSAEELDHDAASAVV